MRDTFAILKLTMTFPLIGMSNHIPPANWFCGNPFRDSNVTSKSHSITNAKISLTGVGIGEFKEILTARCFQNDWVKTDHPAGASYMAQPPQVVPYSGTEITVNPK